MFSILPRGNENRLPHPLVRSLHSQDPTHVFQTPGHDHKELSKCGRVADQGPGGLSPLWALGPPHPLPAGTLHSSRELVHWLGS